MSASSTFVLAGLVASVAGHGFITTPSPRMPGAAMGAACGNQVEVNQRSDNFGNIQGMLQVARSQTDYNAAECGIWLCKGYKLEDNTANVQTFTAGQVVPITVDIRAPHTGVANVSIVNTATNSVIGEPLISWDEYGSTAYSIPADQKQFDITIPSDLGSQCATAGDCVVQWFWNAESIDQTYESCIDFTIGGSESGGEVPASSAVATPVPTPAEPEVPISSAVATPTSAAAVTGVAITPTTLATIVVPSAASSAVAAEPTGISPELLTSVLPTLPAETGAGIPTKALPAGTTLQDLLTWLQAMIADVLAT